jgi:hypothetical protein
MNDAELLRRWVPFLQYDSLESFRSDSAATLAEHFYDDGSDWSYANSLKRKGGTVLASARPRPRTGQSKLDLAFLGKTSYASGAKVSRTDYLDAVGRRYVEDARRLHADARYADRTYGRAVRVSSGATWLQYWFFYYYNDKNFFGIGLHEGDWEMIQIRLGPDGAPTAATFAQHASAHAFNWPELELRSSPSGRVPVVYVGRGSHASFARKGTHWPMFPLPPDYADGKGLRLRPTLELISEPPLAWIEWPGKWGSSDSSPRGPIDKRQWNDPSGFHRDVGGEGRRRGGPEGVAPPGAPPAPPAPKLVAKRVDDRAVVEYEFPKTLKAEEARPARIVVSVDRTDDDLPPASHGEPVRARAGAVAHPLPLEDADYAIRAVAYSEDGAGSRVVTTRLDRPD